MSLPKVVGCLAVVWIAGSSCQSSSRFRSFAAPVATPLAVSLPADEPVAVVESRSLAAPPRDSRGAVAAGDVVRWARDGRSEEQILQALEERRAAVTLTAADENLLRDAGVSESLIEAIKVSSQR